MVLKVEHASNIMCNSFYLFLKTYVIKKLSILTEKTNPFVTSHLILNFLKVFFITELVNWLLTVYKLYGGRFKN